MIRVLRTTLWLTELGRSSRAPAEMPCESATSRRDLRGPERVHPISYGREQILRHGDSRIWNPTYGAVRTTVALVLISRPRNLV